VMRDLPCRSGGRLVLPGPVARVARRIWRRAASDLPGLPRELGAGRLRRARGLCPVARVGRDEARRRSLERRCAHGDTRGLAGVRALPPATAACAQLVDVAEAPSLAARAARVLS